jgi:competence protein ComEA
LRKHAIGQRGGSRIALPEVAPAARPIVHPTLVHDESYRRGSDTIPNVTRRTKMTRFLIAAITTIALMPALTHAQVRPGAQKPVATAAAPINLNTATMDQLESIPGIGAKTAERIIAYRQKNGGFKKIEDLMLVQGVGEKSFLKMKPLITVTGTKPGSQEP